MRMFKKWKSDIRMFPVSLIVFKNTAGLNKEVSYIIKRAKKRAKMEIVATR